MAVTFHKMHGLGNDFVVLDLRGQDFPLDANMAARIADRHTGVGCDQILVLRKPVTNGQLAAYEVWNADGSRAEQCGNGVRCLGLYLQQRGEAPAGGFLLGGSAAAVKIECLGDDRVRVDMGQPRFAPDQVPVRLAAVDGWYPLRVGGQQYRLGAVSMGNPHALVLVDDVDNTPIGHAGETISRDPAFPEGCNVGFAEIVNRRSIRLRVYERGAAETRACGSGACAAMTILRAAGMVEDSVEVTQAGGILIIQWSGGEKPVIMTGPATYVFEGILK